MAFQLILQFRGEALPHFLAIGDRATRLAEALGDDAELEGEDVGAHGGNIFIFTDKPKAVFEIAADCFGAKAWPGFVAAYRHISSETFRVLWPVDHAGEFRIR